MDKRHIALLLALVGVVGLFMAGGAIADGDVGTEDCKAYSVTDPVDSQSDENEYPGSGGTPTPTPTTDPGGC